MKTILIMSGGLDSTVLLHELKSRRYKIYGVTFDYGQKHSREIEYAQHWAERMCTNWKMIRLDFMPWLVKSALIDAKWPIPDEPYKKNNQHVTVVPNRNMIFTSIAVAWAETVEAETVFLGVHAGDHEVYPDCRPEFVNSINITSQLATHKKIKVCAPYSTLMKHEIVSKGDELNVQFEYTWSCYKGGRVHCGTCPTCRERKNAFKQAKIEDSTFYEV